MQYDQKWTHYKGVSPWLSMRMRLSQAYIFAIFMALKPNAMQFWPNIFAMAFRQPSKQFAFPTSKTGNLLA
jgi:hypothetical protein